MAGVSRQLDCYHGGRNSVDALPPPSWGFHSSTRARVGSLPATRRCGLDVRTRRPGFSMPATCFGWASNFGIDVLALETEMILALTRAKLSSSESTCLSGEAFANHLPPPALSSASVLVLECSGSARTCDRACRGQSRRADGLWSGARRLDSIRGRPFEHYTFRWPPLFSGA